MVFGPWDPLRELLGLPEPIEGDRRSARSESAPAVDVYETPTDYVLTAELPGVDREHVQIDVHGGQLTLLGRRRDPGVQPEQYHRLERAYGAFHRTFSFALPIEEAGITAEFQKGVLTVRIPKTAGSASHRVPVQ